MVDYHKFPTELSILCRLFNRYPHENPQISLESDGKSIPWSSMENSHGNPREILHENRLKREDLLRLCSCQGVTCPEAAAGLIPPAFGEFYTG